MEFLNLLNLIAHFNKGWKKSKVEMDKNYYKEKVHLFLNSKVIIKVL